MACYRKVKKLGSGAFGKVFLAVHTQTFKRYAIKEIVNIQTPSHLSSSMKEVSFLRELDHPFIVKFYEYYYKNGCLSIALEYCCCGNLNNIIRHFRNESISQWKIYQITSQLCLALRYIHRRNIIHRDLKPENILIYSNNCIKISDFGVSKKLRNNSRALTFAGTTLYMSPEMLNFKSYDFSTDIWSFGVVLYEMIGLQKPFPNISSVLNGKFTPLDKRIGRDFRYIVFWTLQLNPSRRISMSAAIRNTSLASFIFKHYPGYI